MNYNCEFYSQQEKDLTIFFNFVDEATRLMKDESLERFLEACEMSIQNYPDCEELSVINNTNNISKTKEGVYHFEILFESDENSTDECNEFIRLFKALFEKFGLNVKFTFKAETSNLFLQDKDYYIYDPEQAHLYAKYEVDMYDPVNLSTTQFYYEGHEDKVLHEIELQTNRKFNNLSEAIQTLRDEYFYNGHNYNRSYVFVIDYKTLNNL